MDFDPALEPRSEDFGGWDIAIIILGIIVYKADIAALTFMYRKQQDYLPFRSKNMGVFVLAQCCGALYWIFNYVYMVTHYGERPREYLEEFNARLAQDRLDELTRSDITPLSAQSNSATNHGSRDEAPQNADRDFFSDKASIDRVFNPRHSGFQPLPFDKKSSFLV
ncbi:hypothetical protein IWQ62_000169 [Dispira parvispora]|uniref:Uncharacterized protein n=1 Tax=Dispira parvispora TaxID=1520584 RepID=A0A9W8B0S5_9FUNG|nr:hypothetical protein IWQ62_000169 [Dispira parvispora]